LGVENADLFSTVADRNRRRILELLGEGEKTVGELVGALRLRQPLVSHHLTVLRGLGLVDARREGRHRIYRIPNAAIARKLKGLEAAATAVLEAADPGDVR
jgi:DNA-binding transcriptional ArsR family regulator